MLALFTIGASISADAAAGSGAGDADSAVLEVEKALSSGALGRALARGRAAAEDFPSDGRVRTALGDALVATLFFEEAATEYERARALGSDTPELAAAWASALWSGGRGVRAREVISAARTRWPEQSLLDDLWSGMETDRRLRGGERTAHPEGSAPDFVAGLARKLERGALMEIVGADLDEGFLRAWQAGGLDLTGSSREAFVRGVADSLRKALESGERRIVGYDVDPGTTERDGRTFVTMSVLVEGKWGASQLSMVERAIDEPRLRSVVDPGLLHVMRELGPDDRRRLLDLMRTRTAPNMATVEFELVKKANEWKLADARVEGSPSSLSAMLANMSRLVKDRVVGDPPESTWYRLGYMTGLLLPLALLGVLIWVGLYGVRLRRRRNAG